MSEPLGSIKLTRCENGFLLSTEGPGCSRPFVFANVKQVCRFLSQASWITPGEYHSQQHPEGCGTRPEPGQPPRGVVLVPGQYL